MSKTERKETTVQEESVICVYCGETMGWEIIERSSDGRIVTKDILDNLNLGEVCLKSPNRKHANMTPEQARTSGFKVK